jgi:hypothetical protein
VQIEEVAVAELADAVYTLAAFSGLMVMAIVPSSVIAVFGLVASS